MSAIPNGVTKIELSDKRPVNGHSSQNSLDSLSQVPSSSAASRIHNSYSIPDILSRRNFLHQALHLHLRQQHQLPLRTTLERTPTKKELKDAAKKEKEERKEREKREKEEAKLREKEGKKLGRSSLGTIKRWGKDKDKDKS